MNCNLLRSALAVALLAGPAAAETPVERGEYLVRGPMGCGNCHTPQGPDGPDMSRELGGFLILDIPDVMTAWARNITPGSRVAQWTDAELARAIREGIRPDGSLIGPPMPFVMYRGLGDEDLAAIVAFLRTLPAVEGETPESAYHIPLPPAWGPPVESVTAPERAVTVEYGAYLAGPVAHCLECHMPMDGHDPFAPEALGRGGWVFDGPWGQSVAANLTSHADGLAGYSDDEIKAMVTEGLRPDGSAMLPPMPYGYLAKMTPEDLDALVLYLRTLPPLPDHPS
jgi:mono/diheme cytochrome c family protein